MNDASTQPSTTPVPPPLPSVSGTAPAPDRPPEDHADNRRPISGMADTIEAMLRHPRRLVYQLGQPPSARLILLLLGIGWACALVYGLVVGTFSGGIQLWAAPLKIAGGLTISALICLPSLYVFACLNGSRARLLEVGGMVAGLVALMTVLLVGFAPVAWVFSESTNSLVAMGGLHLAFWLVSTYFGLRFLHTGLSQISGKSAGLRIWMMVFLMVMMQMTTALRPLVGTAETFLPREKKFFLRHWLEQMRTPPEPAKGRG